MRPNNGSIERKYHVALLGESCTYPPEGCEIRLTCFADGREIAGTYQLKQLGTNDEPRGVLLEAQIVAEARNPREPSDDRLPDRFVLRFPDLKQIRTRPDVPDRTTSERAYLAQFKEHIKREKEILARLEDEPVAHLLRGDSPGRADQLSLSRDGDTLPILFREWIEGTRLDRYCQNIGLKDRSKGIPLARWFPIAEKLIHVIHRIHLAGAPHGYICPRNVIECKGELKLINFERDLPDPTLLLNSDERKDPTLFWRRPYDSPERSCYYRPKPGTPSPPDPFVPGDLYSLGLTLLYLATGQMLQPFAREEQWDNLPWNKVINPLRKSDIAVKTQVREWLSEAMVEGVKPRDDYQYRVAAAEIIFACLRISKHRFYNTRAILEVFRQCDPRPGKAKMREVSATSVLEALENLNHSIDSDKHIANTLLCNLYKVRLARAFLPFGEDDATYRRYTVGTRAEIVDALVTIFAQMAIDGYTTCTALTTATFFFEENCSSGGRVFSSLQRAVERGAQVKWLFVVNESRLNDTAVVDVLAHQKDAWLSLPDRELGKVYAKENTRWRPKGPVQYREFLRDHESFLYLESQDSQHRPVLVIPDYSAEPGRIIALRVFPVPEEPPARLRKKADALLKLFESEWARGRPLDRFPHPFLGGRFSEDSKG